MSREHPASVQEQQERWGSGDRAKGERDEGEERAKRRELSHQDAKTTSSFFQILRRHSCNEEEGLTVCFCARLEAAKGYEKRLPIFSE
jgi:hypothetical protein